MGIYSEYLDKGLSSAQLVEERKVQLKKISVLRGGRDVLVFAADLTKGGMAPISIGFDDLLPIHDQLSNLPGGTALDFILETPGGSGEVAEDIVNLLRSKYDDIAIIVPGWAKSAGSIMAMAFDEILMEPASALGPIDAQWSTPQGKGFSADALIKGLEKIKQEVSATGSLNKAYIPILQGISPGELQSAQNALDFAKVLVTKWLADYKFKNWTHHSSTGEIVTSLDRSTRAEEIANKLCDHGSWLTHGRSIKISNLEDMKLKILDYSKEPDLADAIRRYYTLLRMTFASNLYKLIETPTSQIQRFISPQIQAPGQGGVPNEADAAIFNIQCAQCQTILKVQANLNIPKPLQPGVIAFPLNNILLCPSCNAEINLTEARRQIETQSKKTVV